MTNADSPAYRLNEAQIACLKQAASQPDGTVLCIGFNRHDSDGPMKTHATATAIALERRGLLQFLKVASWGNVLRITSAGQAELERMEKK